MVHHTVVGQGDHIDLLTCSHLDHGDTFPDSSCCLHSYGHLLISQCRVNMKCHISHLMIIDLNVHLFFQDFLQYLRHLEFAVKKHLDIISQGIADLLMITDTSHCKRDMISQRKNNPFIYSIPEGLLRFS